MLRELSIPVLVLVFAACGGPPAASVEMLAGTWEVDFDATWEESREVFLADTLRGSNAYPADPDEKEAKVREEMKKFLGDSIFTFDADGAVATNLGGPETRGTFEVSETAGATLRLSADFGKKQDVEATFETEDLLRWKTRAGESHLVLVLRRR